MISAGNKRRLFLLVPLLLCFAFASEKIAIVTKIVGMAEYVRKKEPPKGLKRGFLIESGDEISTKRDAFVALVFIDDRSALKIRERSQIVINGKKNAKKISKKIDLNKGIMRAQVNSNRDFQVQTSVSVASVKGTDFWLVTNPETGDEIIGLEGIVGLTNSETGQEIDVSEGMSGISTPGGSLGLQETDQSSIPDDPSEETEGPSEIRIYLEGPNGEQKVIIIDYQ